MADLRPAARRGSLSTLKLLRVIFGAAAQVAVGAVCLTVAGVAWIYWTLTPPTVFAIFHVSMFFGVVACYAIVATGLGFRATERVEQMVDQSS